MAASRTREKLIWLAGLIAIVVVFVWVVPRVASYADIWQALKDLSPAELALLLGLGLSVIALNGWSTVATLPGLTWRQGAQSGLCGNFLTALFPTGADLAVRFAMFRSWGYEADEVTTAIALASVGRYLTMLMLPIVGTSAVLVTGRGDAKTPWLFAVGVLAFVFWSACPGCCCGARISRIASRTGSRRSRAAGGCAAPAGTAGHRGPCAAGP